MSDTTNHFKLGLFIIVGSLLILGTAAVLGAGALWGGDTIPAETYFNESVQGLDLGAPVKFRGVQIGRVKTIGFLSQRYDPKGDTGRYVLVGMELSEKTMGDFLNNRNIETTVPKLVGQGLRVRMTTQGLTGVGYLEVNFFDPRSNPELPLTWEPETLYIPSAPSTLSRIESALESIARLFKKLEGADFQSLVNTLDSFVKSLDKALQEAEVSTLGELLAQNLTELRSILNRVNELLQAPEVDTIIPDASASASTARRILEDNEQDLRNVIETVRDAARKFDRAATQLDNFLNNPQLRKGADKLPDTLDNIEQASVEIRKAAVQLKRLLGSLDALVLNERDDVSSVIEDIKSVLQNLDALTGDLKQNPSRLILGEPPPRVPLEENR
ncbi:MAG: MlaD family protein [Oceanidesulfovibrio sp.]